MYDEKVEPRDGFLVGIKDWQQFFRAVKSFQLYPPQPQTSVQLKYDTCSKYLQQKYKGSKPFNEELHIP